MPFRFGKSVKISNYRGVNLQSSFETHCQILSHVRFKGHLGYGSYYCSLFNVSAQIGRFTSIASNVCTIAGRHAYKTPFVATSPMFFSLNPEKSQAGNTFATEQMFDEFKFAVPEKQLDVEIGNDVWIEVRGLC